MKYLAFLSLLLAGHADAAPCLTYSDATIQGVLSSESFAGPPNYESVAAGDKEETYFFVTLQRPACISKGSSDFDVAIEQIRKVQLVFEWQSAQPSYKSLQPFLTKNVTCTGVLFGRQTGHHHSDVLLDKAKCHAT